MERDNMKTLSVKQPWAYLLCSGIKDIENRTWKLPEKYKGERVLIHASASADKGNLKDKFPTIYWDSLSCEEQDSLILNTSVRSAIIGSVRFVDCVINHESIWAEKGYESKSYKNKYSFGVNLRQIYNWVVADPILFDKPILNVKGKLSFWDYEMESIEEAYRKANSKAINDIFKEND